MSAQSKLVFQAKKISKRFLATLALDEASLNVYQGKVMGVLGENGAGKSTLMKVITGVYQKDSGALYLDGNEVNFANVSVSQMHGISMVHQEPHILPDLTIGENIMLGQEPMKNRYCINTKQMYQQANAILSQLGMNKKATTLADQLSIGDQKMLEIAKALVINAKIIIMDEPTDALTISEVNQLFCIIRSLCSEGKSIIYISHRMEEIFDICDDITIMRDGKFITECKVNALDEKAIIEKMVGKKLSNQLESAETTEYNQREEKQIALSVEGLSNRYFHKLSFDLCQGEILGVFGLMGAGRTELAKSIYGTEVLNAGKIYLNGKAIQIHCEKDAIKEGIIYVCEDRKHEGLLLERPIVENISLSSLERISNRFGIIQCKAEKDAADYYIKLLSIKAKNKMQLPDELSGGNQQKVAIARALMCQPKILILDEPTRGVDVGAKHEIYRLIYQLKSKGISILLISSEMPEVVGLSDRMLVMRDKKIVTTLDVQHKGNFTQSEILKYAMG
ncbi:sugar ABC transporter ATP-binding protein [Fangia hongkongensis]|uniref:sugar ABC transporter ATP-binding protein n=1 Tax=Fangia hongkongensis TaxID=270495 RepID=UPI000374F5D5|nr:sugar ABC transporter ATP-binding protein [Fangia hongkongensis]MBK2125190.1 sugar ABC transporter ATP-binding protein [Fangia hongkongensis]